MNHRETMVSELVTKGVVTSPWIRDAFRSVPREIFVPRFYRRSPGGSSSVIVDSDDPAQREEWLTGVYNDVALVVHATPVADVHSSVGLPTSSSSMPSVMAGMLEALDLQPGHRVLEIGTGTGYNAALLSQRVGDANVTTVELHPVLAETARTALGSIGLHPEILIGDGATLLDGQPRFDRIIGTAAIDHVPHSWITLLTENGRIVADLRGSLDGGIISLDRIAAGTVEGKFLDVPGAFMPMRTRVGNPHRDGEDWQQVVLDKTDPHHGHTTVDPRLITDPNMRFLAQLHLAGHRLRGFLITPGEDELSGHSTSGSWADVATAPDAIGTYSTHQGGPERLWDIVEAAYLTWERLGKPTRTQFGVSASVLTGVQTVWINNPDSADMWSLPL